MSNDTQYLVRKIETCPTCHGEKFLYNPEWTEANAEYDRLRETIQDPVATMDAWDKYIKEKWPYGEPLEEGPCEECEGEGKIEKWVDLEQALQELGVLSVLETFLQIEQGRLKLEQAKQLRDFLEQRLSSLQGLQR